MADGNGRRVVDENRDITRLGEQIRVMGEVTYLLSHSPDHLGYTLADMVRFFLTPIRMGQFRIYRTDDRPVAITVWAWLGNTQSEGYANGEYELKEADWKSGKELWFIEFVAPFGHAPRVVEDLRQHIFPKERGRFFRRRDGYVHLHEILGIHYDGTSGL